MKSISIMTTSRKYCEMLWGNDLSVLHGYRLIDYRGGQSLHSWELGMKGACPEAEIRFMNMLILNRRKPEFGKDQDGKMLTLEQSKSNPSTMNQILMI